MKETIKEILWEDLKNSAKFFIKNFREIMKRTWDDFLNEIRTD